VLWSFCPPWDVYFVFCFSCSIPSTVFLLMLVAVVGCVDFFGALRLSPALECFFPFGGCGWYYFLV
jgi:hypothetical protein